MQEFNAYFKIYLETDALPLLRDGLIRSISDRVSDFLRLGDFCGLAPVLIRLELRPHRRDWRRIHARARVGAVVIDEGYSDVASIGSGPADFSGPAGVLAFQLRARLGVRLGIYFGGRPIGFLRLSKKRQPEPVKKKEDQK